MKLYKLFLMCMMLLSAAEKINGLIIYRPSNSSALDTVCCFLTVTDMDGNDVTYSKAKAGYEWVTSNLTAKSVPKVYFYEKSFYLSGGMAMHITLEPGKYILTFSTPVDKQNNFSLPANNADVHDWMSNEYFLDTENAPRVIFVSPTANENGFYNGGWHISYRAPEYFKWTKPFRKDCQE